MKKNRYKSLPTPNSQVPTIETAVEFRVNPIYNWLRIATLLTGMTLVCSQQVAAQAVADQPLQSRTDTQRIEEVISLLGHTDPTIRRNARAELEQFGAAAINELEKAAEFETTLDYETQITAADILRTLQNSLSIEAANQFVRGEGELTGWQAFKKFAGDTLESRSLFRDVYLKNHSELEKTFRTSTAPNIAHETTVSYFQLKTLIESSELPNVHFGMFLLARQLSELNSAQSDDEFFPINTTLTKQQLIHLLNVLTNKTSLRTKERANSQSIALLVRAIIENAPKEHPLLSEKISLIQQFNSPELYPLLVEFAAKENPTVIRAMAIAHAIKICNSNNFDQFNDYLADTTVVGHYLVAKPHFGAVNKSGKPAIREVQIRDVILLGNLRLASEDHTEFGFNPKAVNISNNEVDIKLAGFINNEAREKALERYRRTNQ